MIQTLNVVFARLRRRRRDAGAITGGALALVFVAGVALSRRSVETVATAVVRRATFTETLLETGTVNAQRLALYASTIPGVQAKIVELVREGVAVAPGDLLVRFDASTFEQTRARERAALSQAEADLLRVRQELQLETLNVEATLESARQQVDFAQTGLRNQLEGRGRVELAEADAAAAEATRELDRAKKTVDDLSALMAEGLITRAELDRAEQAWHRAAELKGVADTRRDALVKYEQPAADGRAQAELHAARQALAREGDTASARSTERRAAVAAAESRVQEIKARIAILEDQIARTEVRASTHGLVIYRDLFFGNDRRKPQVGDEVWPNQPILAVPDSEQLIVETRVPEVDLHKVSASERVEVRVDAYPDLRLPASVTLVGALAQDDATRAGTKFFPVTVTLRGGDARLRAGMTARVDIEVQTLPSALIVPVEAVFDDHNSRFVVVLRGGQWVRCSVRVRAENDTEAALDGELEAGDRVALVEPASARRR